MNFEDFDRLIPNAKPDDLEDVAWALQTAATMWNRGENAEAIKWVRRAAEAAYEGERDERGLELTKAAADISGMIARRSVPDPASAPAVVPAHAPAAPPPAPPAPAAIAAAVRASVAPQPPTPKAPPVGAAPSSAPQVPPSKPPPPVSKPPPPAPPMQRPGSLRPAATTSVSDKKPAAPKAFQGPAAGKPPVVGSARGEPRRPRKSGTSFTEEAKQAKAKKRASRPERTEAAPPPETGAPGLPEQRAQHLSNTEVWDMSPTQNMAGEDLEAAERTRIGPAPAPAPAVAESPRVLSAPPKELATAQAVRVVIWQDTDGVHVAPHGTVVSAITAEALLVALDPSTDLAAWLSAPARKKS